MMGEVIRVSGRAPDVGEFLKEAMLSQRFADVALCCPGGQRFLAHRLVLSAASPYLQEVLLAHSRTSSHCEPITVILAEVEAPELAAILGFVYTGSATVPRPRLNAFLHAAEALHIRLPPVPVVMTCSQADCKQEDIKDVKISPKYLQCDQYPCCDRWYRPRVNQNGGSAGKEEQLYPCAGKPLEAARGIRPLPESMNFAAIRYAPDRYCSTAWPVAPFAAAALESNAVHGGGDLALDKDRMSQMDGRRFHPSDPAVRIDRIGDVASGHPRTATTTTTTAVDNCGFSGCDVTARTRQQQSFCHARDYEVRGGRQLDALEARMKTDGGQVQLQSRKGEEEFARSTSICDDTCCEQQRIPGGRLTVIRSRVSGSYQTPSAPLPGARRSYERSPDFGEDLSCRDNCFAWRPRRQVANRVIASPWKQTIRPYHLPKLQPIVLQPHLDDTEARENAAEASTTTTIAATTTTATTATTTTTTAMTPTSTPTSTSTTAASRPPAISTSPNLRFSQRIAAPVDHYYNIEVPTTREPAFGNSAKLSDASAAVTAPRTQEFYPPQLPPATVTAQINHQPALLIGHEPKGNESVLQPQTNAIPTATRCPSTLENNGSNSNSGSSSNNNNQMNVNRKSYFGQTSLPQSPQKPEISHPVSRLCDTIETNDKKSDRFAGAEAEKVKEERKRIEEKKIAERVVINSDNNNNDAAVSQEAVGRATGRGGQENHRCDQCGKSFVTRASLKVHIRTHSGEKPFRCADCGKQFSQLRNYKYHRSVHEGTREFAATCPECGKYFNDRGYLSSHMKIHRNRKEYGCAECGKSFNQRVAYNMHVRIHTGVKPHQCEQCGKAFSRKMLLKQHLRTHSGERPYQCQVCQKAFADRSNMTLHTRLHSGLKPYQCTLCSKAFTKKHHLKTHLNYHTGTKPYSCPNCGLRFSQSSNMRTHYKKCTVNNPAEVRNSGTESGVLDTSRNAQARIVRTPTETLTPPNSDQELSILTPISKNGGVEAPGT